LAGVPAADVLLLNDDDLTYAKLRLDERSMDTVVEHIAGFDNTLARALCWAAAWDMVRDGQLAARDYVRLVTTGLPAERDINLVTATLAQARPRRRRGGRRPQGEPGAPGRAGAGAGTDAGVEGGEPAAHRRGPARAQLAAALAAAGLPAPGTDRADRTLRVEVLRRRRRDLGHPGRRSGAGLRGAGLPGVPRESGHGRAGGHLAVGRPPRGTAAPAGRGGTRRAGPRAAGPRPGRRERLTPAPPQAGPATSRPRRERAPQAGCGPSQARSGPAGVVGELRQ